MSEKKKSEQLLKELIQMQKTIEHKVEEQDSLIKRFQQLIQNEGLFSQVISNFPYPLAIFDSGGTLIMANQILLQKASIRHSDIDEKRINFFSRITNENAEVLQAAEDTFLGETTHLKNLIEPLTMFARDDSFTEHSGDYQSAVFFPLYSASRIITHGAVLLMR